ncbi:MAG: aminopeptidase [Planctomycetes bacterium]|nr:aminopeptidase [Planctomycetota bacterium]
MRFGWLALSAALLPLVPACTLPYLLRQASGQVEMLAGARPVAEVAADPSCSPALKSRLAELTAALAYAARSGFYTEGAYEAIVPPGVRQSVHVLTAAPPDRLEAYRWDFPLVGSLPLKGFFDLDAARREEALLRARGFETRLGDAAAYSTLGWLPDPIVQSMIEEPLGRSLEILFHELTHRTLFVAGDARFNENFASFVGETTAKRYLAERGEERSPEFEEYSALVADELRLREVAARLHEKLEAAFRDPDRAARLAARERCFAEANAEIAAAPFRSARLRGVRRVEWSIPLLLSIDLYRGEGEQFAAALARSGGDLARLFAALRALPSGGSAVDRLRAWLATSLPEAENGS